MKTETSAPEPVAGDIFPEESFKAWAAIERTTVDEKKREVDVSFSSESPIRDFAFGLPVALLHERSAVDLSPLRTVAGVTMNHNPDRLVASIRSAELDEASRKGRATIRFDETDDGEKAFVQVRGGSLRGVSVDYVPEKGVRVEEDESWTSPGGKVFHGPVRVATRWRAVSFSLTPIPADRAVGVGRNEGNRSEETGTVDKTTTTVDEEALREEGRRQEQIRQRELKALGKKSGIGDATVERWINEGTSFEVARQKAFEHMVETHKPISQPSPDIEFGADRRDLFVDAHIAGLLARMGVEPDKTVEPEPCTLGELARRCLVHRGIKPGWRLSDTAHRALQIGTSDLPAILENVIDKMVAVTYEQAAANWSRWAKKDTIRDFKLASRLAISASPDLLETPELAPVIEAAVADKTEKYKIATYARRLGISRQAIVNDDLGLIQDFAGGFTAAARRLPDELLVTLLISNPTMADGNALFDTANHGNLAAAGGAPALDTLGEARRAMRVQRGPAATSGEPGPILNITPAVIVVPAALETAVEELLASIARPDAAQSGVANVFQAALELVVDSRLDADSATAWYIFSAPAAFPAALVGFLDGQENPTLVREDNAEGVLGVSFLAYVDVGAKFIDWRGAYRNPGA